jgi:putative ABC transport system substrate-binding protein
MAIHIRRREFIFTLGGAAAAWPLAARAQQPSLPVIGFLNSTSLKEWQEYVAAFHQGLNDAGYVEGRNVAIEYRWAEGNYDRLPELASDLVSQRVTVIVTSGGDITTWAAKAVTGTIPIVFMVGNDPVRSGLVARLNRPESNATGVTMFGGLLNAKRLEILREAAPHADVIAALLNPNSARIESDTTEIQNVTRELGLRLYILHAAGESDFEAVFATLVARGAKGLLVAADPMFVARRAQLVALASRHSIPAIYFTRAQAEAGGLMSYGANTLDLYRQLGLYAGRIVSGAKPVDLPVQQPVKVELILNLKTAKALGLTFPLTLLGRADEVIE